MAAATQAWNTITSSNRSLWNAWAAANPQYAKHNPSSVLSGFAVFTKWHFNHFLGEGDISDINTTPTYTIVPKDDPSFSLQWSSPNLNLIHSWANGGGNLKVNVFISQPFQASINFVGSRVRFLDQIVNTNATQDVYSEYINLYGKRPEVGEKVFIECVQRNTDNGMVYARQTFEVVVTAP